jgi:hypothetical protein
MIKRYNLGMEEAEEGKGEWVKAVDHDLLVSKQDQQIRLLSDQVLQLRAELNHLKINKALGK